MKPYESLSGPAQIARLTGAAHLAWNEYDLGDARIEPHFHGYNTTFRVKARNGRRYALRLDAAGRRKPGDLTAEVAWTTALAEAGLPAPHPVQSRGVWVPFEGRENGVAAVLFDWLPGKVAGVRPEPWMGAALGRLTKALHAQAEHYRLPEGATVGSGVGPSSAMAARMDVYPAYREVVAKADEVWQRLRREPLRLIHNDLHPGNLMAYRGRLSAFDFDDMCLGHPAYDATVTTYYIRNQDPRLQEGYRRELPPESVGLSEADFETLVAGRQAALAGYLFQETNKTFSAIAERYATVAEARLASFLKTGRFDPSVARFRR
ncbi:hypothetical protein BH11ARM2_BH11ARM2_22230 [soil metagenome]